MALSTVSTTTTTITTSVVNTSCAVVATRDQVFRLSLPGTRRGELICNDWSHGTRRHISLLKAGSDPNQLKITSFFEYIDTVTNCIKSTPHLQEVLKMESAVTGTICNADNFNGILKRLILNAEKNAGRAYQGRRHDFIVKKFATSLFIFSGPLAYNFLQQNLPLSLPSLRSIQRCVSKEYTHICTSEGEFDLMDCFHISINTKHQSLLALERMLHGLFLKSSMTVTQTEW